MNSGCLETNSSSISNEGLSNILSGTKVVLVVHEALGLYGSLLNLYNSL